MTLRRSEGLWEARRRAAWAARPIFGRARAYLALLCACALCAAPAARAESTPLASARVSAQPLPTRLARALAVPHVNHTRSGAVAVDLVDGGVVFERNPDLALAPAST